ncbi:MAG: prolipoprotein diacylglyceryl transferase [Rhodoferax sp.]|nr:prolipoprotein diacylglyceryl transferase [Actinomycetota bacterium]
MITSIPSPAQGVWHLGPVPVRAYALCILVGIVIAVLIAERRWVRRGGQPGGVADLAGWAVPFGIVGARLYHVVSSPQAYFGAGGHPLGALKIWQGGLGIWGAVAGGALGAWIACRRRGWSFLMFADSAAPGVAVAQAVGRLGNWFNQELFGRPTTLPWGLEISPEHRPVGYAQFATYHPTFLYEALWCLLVAALVVVLDRRLTLDHGRSLALYVGAYTVGRAYFESLRIDPANRLLNLRLNEWTSLVVGLGALAGFLLASRAAQRMSHHVDTVSTS